MSTSEALSIIAAANGQQSTAYRNACILAARGRRADILASASAILARRRGRILHIAA